MYTSSASPHRPQKLKQNTARRACHRRHRARLQIFDTNNKLSLFFFYVFTFSHSLFTRQLKTSLTMTVQNTPPRLWPSTHLRSLSNNAQPQSHHYLGRIFNLHFHHFLFNFFDHFCALQFRNRKRIDRSCASVSACSFSRSLLLSLSLSLCLSSLWNAKSRVALLTTR